jgi:hypothetical protein
MTYTGKVLVYAADDPKVFELIRKAVEGEGTTVRDFDVRPAGDGAKELYVELLLNDARRMGDIVRRIEAVSGAAVMAATPAREFRPSKGIPG